MIKDVPTYIDGKIVMVPTEIGDPQKIELSHFDDEVMNVLSNPKNFGSIHWYFAFKYYNENNDKPLHMQCRSCYIKVYFFIKKQLDENS